MVIEYFSFDERELGNFEWEFSGTFLFHAVSCIISLRYKHSMRYGVIYFQRNVK